ncbi:Hypothetical predicted protein [Cloeon dipterum]|uniref:Uncharacterized protein n=1 Tax=Cloeon dipterum TaxID=197152 RepID=A0A8S1CFR2_9INSE|nr:Hypothetical predicted protein [Cloeon dipterum]
MITEKIEELSDAIEIELRGMESGARDGFLSNLSTAIALALQAIAERLPEVPYGQKESVNAAQEQEEDVD